MSTHKKVSQKTGQKELAKKIQNSLETNFNDLKEGLSDKKWSRNIKKAVKILMEDYKQPKVVPSGLKEKKGLKKSVVKKAAVDQASSTIAEAPVKKAAPVKKSASVKKSATKKTPVKNAAEVGKKETKQIATTEIPGA